MQKRLIILRSLQIVATPHLSFSLSHTHTHHTLMYTCRGRPAKGNQAAQGLITAAALCAVDQDLFNPVSRMCKMENRIAFGAMALQVFAPAHAHARTRTHTNAHTCTHTHAQIHTYMPSRALPSASFFSLFVLFLFPFLKRKSTKIFRKKKRAKRA